MSAIETFKDILLPFIETHAGISFENLQLFYGQQIREFHITKEMILFVLMVRLVFGRVYRCTII